MATLWAVGAIAVLVSMAMFGLHLSEAVVARPQAGSADLDKVRATVQASELCASY